MSRSTSIALVIALAAAPLAIACDKSGSDAQTEANQAQEKANAEVSKANDQVTLTAAKAQAKADEKIAAAQADFDTTREDYRHKVQADLDTLNKQIADLDAKAKKSTGTVKANLDATLPSLRAQRDAFIRDFASLQTASANTWDATKDRLDKEWTDLKTAADKAD